MINEITDNPLAGTDLGVDIRKVRMSIKSKGNGKSGGARVITFNYLLDDENRDITLMTVYDKSERETISDKEIIELRNAILGTEEILDSDYGKQVVS